MFFLNIKISGLKISLESDFPFFSGKYDRYFTYHKDESPDVRVFIHKLNVNETSSIGLSNKIKNSVLSTIDFKERWIDNSVFNNLLFRKIIEDSKFDHEMSYFSLSWNRVVFRNYKNNEHHFFYPEEKEYEFNSQLFIARLRNMLFSVFPKFSLLMMHGAGIVLDGKAAVFLAPDEGGKSTVCRLMAENKILNDDHLVIDMKKISPIVHGTPFGNISSGMDYSKLGAFFILEKSDSFGIKPLKGSEILRFIWEDQMIKWFHLPKKLRLHSFELLSDVCKRIPGYKLSFHKDFIDKKSLVKAMKS